MIFFVVYNFTWSISGDHITTKQLTRSHKYMYNIEGIRSVKFCAAEIIKFQCYFLKMLMFDIVYQNQNPIELTVDTERTEFCSDITNHQFVFILNLTLKAPSNVKLK